MLGLGASGLSMARWCAQAGAQVTVADTREAPPQLNALRQSVAQARFVHGPLEASLVEGTAVRAVFKSPGLSPQETQGVLQAAQRMGLWVGSELTLFVHALQQLHLHQDYQPKILAITGTNGKTTVTALTRHLVDWAGKSVAMAGNIGPALLDTLAQAIDAQALPEVWVLELSSFQLDLPAGLEPTAATVLNVTQDHLDWHGDMAAYAGAKARIFGQQGVMVLNRDDPTVMAMLSTAGPSQGAKAPTGGSAAHAVASVGASKSASSKGAIGRHWISFGTDMPRRAGDFGMETVHGMVWLVRAMDADETRRRRKEAEPELFFQRLMPMDALRIRGRHNASNALAALALAASAGCPLGPILYGLREYRGEPHRVEPIGILRDVEYFDDSKGTNVGATVAALQGLGADRKVVVILGGEGKGQDFEPLAQPVQRFARAVCLIGRDAPRLRAALAHTGVAIEDAPSLPEAVRLAAQCAQAGDAVLLSPACASFDMFDNYEHRARVFCTAVQELALAQGVDLEQSL